MELERLEYIERVNRERFRDGVSRRRFMAALVAAGGGAAGIAALGSTTTALADSTATIINTAITAEALAVTYLGAVINGAYANASGTDATVKAILQAARAAEQDHYTYLQAAGAKPLTLTFTVPGSANPNDKTAALKTIAAAEGLFVNAYLAAVNQFAAGGNYKLATVAASILGVEAEHRALARAALVLGGDSSYSPPNDVAFEQAPLPSVSAVGQQLQQLGFIGGSGSQAQYPGPGTIDSTGVSGTTPPSLSPEPTPGMPNTGLRDPQPGPAPISEVASGLAGLVLGGGTVALATTLRRRTSRS
ncbi:MAG TPA: ferritin-like domain-containing protein [Candidatus Dormibacteraeota bacterium]|nr:ferritin-like domain-containing protein [Candidatus Dormibacteraeota bacterium]